MKFSICNEIFKHLTLEQTFRFVKETGYDAIELAPFTLADSVTLISQAERRRTSDYFVELVKFASDLGARNPPPHFRLFCRTSQIRLRSRRILNYYRLSQSTPQTS